MKKSIFVLFTFCLSVLLLNACSTIEGAGKDIQKAGQLISNEAKKAKKS